MKNHRFEIVLGTLLLAVFLAGSAWFAPGSKLSQSEVDRRLAALERHAPWPAEEKRAILEHLRAWAYADDGRPVYMLNLMRYYRELRPLPGIEGFQGTPEQANALYEQKVRPLLFRLGAYPIFGSAMQGVLDGAQPSTNLISFDPAVDNWSRVLVVRYPSRRAFLELICDPAYLEFLPYKAASLMVALTPMQGDLVLPDALPALAVLLLTVFFAAAWIRALVRARVAARQRD
jgi:hypothetical protein